MSKRFWIIITLMPLLLAAGLPSLLPWPSYFPAPHYTFNSTNASAQITLGKALFYDPILSADEQISCASCHTSYNAFAHTDHALSHGIRDEIGTRNAPALQNLAWQKEMMWDGAINHIEMQALAPITHPKEMGETLPHVIQKLQAIPLYQRLFKEAFGDTTITGSRLLKSLAQFQLSLVSANSKYDLVMQHRDTFTAQERAGYMLFKRFCNSCHQEPLFSNYNFANNGLPVDSNLNDSGRWHISQQTNDLFSFKTPTLRNISYTYPYMHDGRFTKLNEVLNHYTKGIVRYPNLAKELKNPIPLSANDKADLIAFLLTLNDKLFVFNPQHQYPKDLLWSTERKNK
jgi:cytochrome c peroxidase